MKHFNFLYGITLFLLLIEGCGKDDNLSNPNTQGAEISGAILDKETNKPLSNVYLTLVRDDGTIKEQDKPFSESYEFKDLAPTKKYTIIARQADYLDTTITVTTTIGNRTVNIFMTKKQATAGKIRGKISPDNSQKFEGAFIMLASANSDNHYTETRPDTFLFEGVPNGKYELFVYAKGFVKQSSIPITAPNERQEIYQLSSYKGSITFDKPYIDMGPITARTTDVFTVLAPIDNGWEINYDKEKLNWITSIDPQGGKGERSIWLKIDRSKVKPGNNYAELSVRSLTDGSKDELLLTVTETGYGNLADLAIQEEKINVTSTSATIPCEILNPEIGNDYEVGVRYSSTHKDLNESDTWEKAISRNGTSYTVNLTLEANKHYWVTANARNISKKPPYYWGNRTIEIVPKTTLPSVSMQENDVTNITSNSAVFNAKIDSIGAPEYTKRGFVYYTSQEPTIQNSIESLPVDKDKPFSAKATLLELNKKYWVKAYAINSIDTVYSKPAISFEPKSTKPKFTIDDLNYDEINITTRTATFRGNITDAGDPKYTSCGFVYGTTRMPTKAAGGIDVPATSTPSVGEKGPFSATAREIVEGYTYYVSAYVIVNNEPVYSDYDVDFEFIATTPEVTIEGIDILNATSVTFYGYVDREGNPTYTKYGFVWGTSNPPKDNFSGKKEFNGNIGTYKDFQFTATGLTEGQQYYVQAYASNGFRTGYGEVEPFKPESSDYKIMDLGNGEKIAVQKNDYSSASVTWNIANSNCTSSRLGGKTWRLPTIAELRVLYENRNNIGGFAQVKTVDYSYTDFPAYWSSTSGSQPNSHYVKFFEASGDEEMFPNDKASYKFDSPYWEVWSTHTRCVCDLP